MSAESLICDACRRIDFRRALNILAQASQDGQTFHNTESIRMMSHNGSNPMPEDNNLSTGGILLDADPSRFVGPLQTACRLCKIFSSVVCWYHERWSDPADQAQFEQHRDFDLRAFSFLRNCVWADAKVRGAKDTLILLATPSNMYTTMGHASETGDGEAGYVVCYPDGFESDPGLFKPQVVRQAYDFRKARIWLDNCCETHGGGCNIVPETTVLGMRLIDCHTRSIVDVTAGMQWVALSYVWGSTKNDSGSGHPYIPFTIPPVLPKTIEDAMTVTTDLGYRFLWVDEYCIDQRDSALKAEQISRMDLIYRGAELTLIAAAGQDKHHGLPGVSSTQRLQQNIVYLDGGITIVSTGPDPVTNINTSQWRSRGWTYQEGYLSRRRLVFTEHQMYFQCQSVAWMEALGGLEHIPPEVLPSITWPSWFGTIGSYLFRQLSCFDASAVAPRWSLWDSLRVQSRDANADHAEEDRAREADKLFAARQTEFFSLTAEYTRRELSFDGDSLHAFAGMLRALESNEDVPVLNFSGLPYLPGIKERMLMDRYLFAALCWYHQTPTTPRRRSEFPSWTWAGWAGKTRGMCAPMRYGSREAKPMIRGLRLVAGSRMLEGCEEMGKEETRQILGSVKALRFEARFVPPTLFSIKRTSAPEEKDGRSGEPTRSGEVHGTEVDFENDGVDDDWANFLVGKHHLYLRFMQSPTPKPSHFLQLVRDGTWECFLMGDCISNTANYKRFLLVIEPLDEETMVRVGAIVVRSNHYADEANINFFDETELEWRRVTVI